MDRDSKSQKAWTCSRVQTCRGYSCFVVGIRSGLLGGRAESFQSMKTAYATIKGFEITRMIRRRHCILIEPGVTGEVRFVNKLFDLAA